MMKTIILDTNFLLIPGQFGLDIFDRFSQDLDFPYTLAVLDLTVQELEKLLKGSETNQKGKLAVKIAQELIKKQNIVIIKTSQEKNADDALLNSSKKGYVIATQDKDLLHRIKKAGGKSIQMRQKKYLVVK